MDVEKKPVILKWDIDSKEPSFESVLDSACERLWDKHSRYSIRRIVKMAEELDELEKDLDEFLSRYF